MLSPTSLHASRWSQADLFDGGDLPTRLNELFRGDDDRDWLGGLFGRRRKKQVPVVPPPTPATPTVQAPAAPVWQAGVNQTYSNPFGASPAVSTFGSMLSRQPTL